MNVPADQLLRCHLPGSRAQVVVVHATALARKASAIWSLKPTSSALFAQSLSAGLLIGALQKGGDTRLNVQIECDGPVRGLFSDATPNGEVRGYVKNRELDLPHGTGPFRALGQLGRKGYLSVLRDVKGQIFRGMVDIDVDPLGSVEVADLVHRYFDQSEQVPTAVGLAVSIGREEPLERVFGVLVQAMPDGDFERVHSIRRRLDTGWLDDVAMAESPGDLKWLEPLLGEPVVVGDSVLAQYRCTCSRERAVRAVTAMGREEIVDLWEKEGRAEMTCEFCGQRYELNGEELLDLAGLKLQKGGSAPN